MSALVLAASGDRVAVDPDAGGRLTSAVLGGAERLVTAPPAGVGAALAPLQWGAFVMAPWAGRLADGELQWAGRRHQLAPDLDGHALHGVARSAPWQVVEAGTRGVTLTCDLAAAGWPLGGVVDHALRLAPGRLDCTLRVSAGDRAMPAWVGWHPCFRRPDVGDVHLRVDADRVLRTAGMIPTGEQDPVTGDTDLRAGPPLGDRRLDHTYVGVRSPAELTWPDLALQIGFDGATTDMVVFTPAHEIGVEPQTGWPDALHLEQRGVPGAGVTHLAPGATLAATMTWTWTGTDT